MWRWLRPDRGPFTEVEENRILAALRSAERRTSGEIRVHVEARCSREPLEAARWWFNRLGMDRTDQRNGVLFYVAHKDRRFAILGDEGIHRHVGESFWGDLRNRIEEHSKAGHLADGLEGAIRTVGEKLSEAFPRQIDDVNELPDTISYGEDPEAQGP